MDSLNKIGSNVNIILESFNTMLGSVLAEKTSEHINDVTLSVLAKALAITVYRNGIIEDVHAGEGFGAEGFKGIPDSCMKEINKDVVNRIYTLLTFLATAKEENLKSLESLLAFNSIYAKDWDSAEPSNSLLDDLSAIEERNI